MRRLRTPLRLPCYAVVKNALGSRAGARSAFIKCSEKTDEPQFIEASRLHFLRWPLYGRGGQMGNTDFDKNQHPQGGQKQGGTGQGGQKQSPGQGGSEKHSGQEPNRPGQGGSQGGQQR